MHKAAKSADNGFTAPPTTETMYINVTDIAEAFDGHIHLAIPYRSVGQPQWLVQLTEHVQDMGMPEITMNHMLDELLGTINKHQAILYLTERLSSPQ